MVFTFSLISISFPVLPLYLFLYSSYSYIFIINQIEKSSYLKLSFSFLSLCSQIGKLTTQFYEDPNLLTTSGKLSLSCLLIHTLNINASQRQYLTTGSMQIISIHAIHWAPFIFLGWIIIYTFKLINFLTNSLLLTPMSYLLVSRR